MASRFVLWLKNSKSTGTYYSFFLPAVFLLCLALLVGTIVIGRDQTEKSLKRGIEAIRGSRYPKVAIESLQPVPSPQPQLQPQTQPQPSPQNQLELQMQPPPSPPHQLEVQMQPLPSPPPQRELQMQPQPSPEMQPQPSPKLQQQTQMQQESSPQLQLHPEDQKYLSQSQCRPPGSELLPKGLVANTADLQMQPLWGRRKVRSVLSQGKHSPEDGSGTLEIENSDPDVVELQKKINSSTSLFTAAVGIKQMETVDKMVRKFLSCNFNVMLFHYDGIVDAWKGLDWATSVVHVSAVNQTKWWFAKRFLHPDIVAEYSHIFLWDEDLGVENFDPDRYLSIVKEEGLEISQPALDKEKSEVHHAITARWSNSTVHRRAKPSGNSRGCNSTSEYPPCTGWVELMAPVFSRTAWRCMWYMIQKDLNHAWGLDILFGYCAQGDRTKNVGVVDAEYVVHYAFPTFGGEPHNMGNADPSEPNPRTEVRRHSFREYKIFRKRWQIAVKEDESWVDPYPGSLNISMI